MSFDDARAAKQQAKAYRIALRDARTKAVELAAKILGDAAKSSGEANPDAVKAMAEIFKEAREVLAPSQKKLRVNKPGIRGGGMSTEEAERIAMGEEEDK